MSCYPFEDGWSIVADLRRRGDRDPRSVLTARDAVHDPLKGLSLGADDYLVKPFAFSELLARVRSILRRGPGRQSSVLKLADLELDLHRHRATRAGQPLELTPKEFQLLSLLLRRAGDVLSRTLIAEQVWTSTSRAIRTWSKSICAGCARKWMTRSTASSSTLSAVSAMSSSKEPDVEAVRDRRRAGGCRSPCA